MPDDQVMQPGPPKKTKHRLIALIFLVILAAIVVLPIWNVHYPPLLDFPTHVASAFVLANLHNSNYEFAHYYSAEWAPDAVRLNECIDGGVQPRDAHVDRGKAGVQSGHDWIAAGRMVFSAPDKSRR